MKVKTGWIFLVYDKSSYWLYYPILGMKLFLTRFSQKWFLCAHRPHTKLKNKKNDSVWEHRNQSWKNLVKNIFIPKIW